MNGERDADGERDMNGGAFVSKDAFRQLGKHWSCECGEAIGIVE